MDDQVEGSSVTAPSQDQAQPNPSEATPEQAPTTPSSSGSNVENEGTSTTAPSDNTESNADQEEINRKREREKAAKLEKDIAKVNKKYGNVASFIAKDPELLKRAYVELNGLTEEQAIVEVRKVHPSYSSTSSSVPGTTGETSNPAPAGSVLTPQQQEALDKITRDEDAKQADTVAAITEFLDENPGLDEADQQAISAAAHRLVNKSGKTVREALKLAKVQILEPEKYKEEGIIEGKAQALSGTSPQSGGSSGSVALGSDDGNISDLDHEIADKLGLSRDPEAMKNFEAHVKAS